MAIGRRRRHSKLGRIVFVLVAAVVAFCAFSSYMDKQGQGDWSLASLELPSPEGLFEWLDDWEPSAALSGGAAPVSTGGLDSPLQVHYLDMGQADSILIQAPGKSVLIDAGENNQGDQVLAYLREQGISRLDYVIGTHPHSDHIGGLDTVIDQMNVGEVILPDIPQEITPTTVTYTDLLLSIAKKQLKVHTASPGVSYDLGGGAKLVVLGPVAQYNNLNNVSVTSRLEYGDISFLFTGDMEKEAELGLLESRQKLAATVMDVGHHGSNTSSTREFLLAVRPQLAVISCGVDNSYGHPHREVVERLQELEVEILRTDRNGVIVIGTDGQGLQVSTER